MCYESESEAKNCRFPLDSLKESNLIPKLDITETTGAKSKYFIVAFFQFIYKIDNRT